jgi:hypothetical protein
METADARIFRLRAVPIDSILTAALRPSRPMFAVIGLTSDDPNVM